MLSVRLREEGVEIGPEAACKTATLRSTGDWKTGLN
jgi:hypothetical protein